MKNYKIPNSIRQYICQGKTINDVWIAAHTLEIGSTLIAYDLHFENIGGLRVWEQ
jgi:predicted nucleic acid-binding protein